MNKMFHKGFFREMFRQLRVVGIVAAAILMLSNVTTFLSLVSSIGDNINGYSMPDGFMLAAVPTVFVYVTGLVFTFSVFGWLNKRSTSDFYHSIPIKRTQIFFSSILAVLLWMLIGLAAYSIVHAGIYLLLGKPFNYILFLCVFVNMLIGAMEVVGAVSIACAISGTRFVNLFASAVILFIPRFMLTVLALFVERIGSDTLVVPSLSILFDPTYNIFATPYAGLTSDVLGSITMRYSNGWAMLYNLAYDIVLFLLGCIAFKKRKSESAGMPTTGRLFNGVIRTAVGMPFLLILAYLMVNGDVELVGGVILVLLAFVFYCLYELISTKRAKKMLKAMPLFFICIGISVLYLVIPYLIDKVERSVSISEDNIRGYSIVDDDADSGSLLYMLFGNYQTPSYSSIQEEKIVYSDPESIRIIVDAYNVSNEKEPHIYGEREYRTVRIYRKFGRSITRNLCFNATQSSKLLALRRSNDEYLAIKNKFPDGKNYYSIVGLNIKESAEIGQLFRSEYEALSESDKLTVWDFSNYNGDISVFGYKGARNYEERYTLSSLTPRSYELYLRKLNEKNGEKADEFFDSVIRWMESGNQDEQIYFTIRLDSELSIDIDTWMLRYMQSPGAEGVKPAETDPEAYEIIKMLAALPKTDNYKNSTMLQISDDTALFGSNYRISVEIGEAQREKLIELYSNTYPYDQYDQFENEPDY